MNSVDEMVWSTKFDFNMAIEMAILLLSKMVKTY